jgi:subtilase family serine protease
LKLLAFAMVALLLIQPAFLSAASQNSPPAVEKGMQHGFQLNSTSLRQAPSMQPQYIILGRLQGDGIMQSSFPRSTPLGTGLLFSATYYTPQVIQKAYNAAHLISAGFGGSGRSIAIIDAFGDPEIYQDVYAFDREFGLPPVNLSIIPVGPYNPTAGLGTGWDVETALDVEAAHAMAPYAHINLIVAANASNAIFEAVKVAVTQNLGDTVSMSWGLPENLLAASGFVAQGFLNYPFTDHYFALGTERGMSFFAASGDLAAFGGTPTSYGAATYPSSSPFVTSVGATTLLVNVTSGILSSENASASYGSESAWSISPQYPGLTIGSGGGYSTLFSAYGYQRAVTNDSRRATPDVSAVGNPYTGLIVFAEGQKLVIGGTSLSTPLWAAMTADMDQYLGRRLGNINQYLYGIYQNRTLYASSFHPVPFGFNGVYSSGSGYNLVTGLGTPDLAGLAYAINRTAQSLHIAVSTSSPGSRYAYPQYGYGSTFFISARVTDMTGSPVFTGSFSARIYTQSGYLTSVPLTFNGTRWTGNYTVRQSDPPNVWRVDVEGSSGGLSGSGSTEVDVGLTITYISPVPFPYAPPIAAGQGFTVYACIQYPNGAPVRNGTLTASFLKEGLTVFSIPLLPYSTSPGCYQGSASIRPGMAQGVYLVQLSGQGEGSAYTYLYFGEAVLNATIISPTDQGVQSVAAGQQLVLLARPITSSLLGQFNSNVTAYIYNRTGSLAASVRLSPAPNAVQLGIFNFFPAQQANFTVPSNMTSGFYTVQFISRYKDSGPVQLGNFTTGLYVAPSTLSATVSIQPTVVEGQYVKVSARISGLDGSPVTGGLFTATVGPTELNFESLLVGYFTGVPMQYDASAHQWVGYYRIPSILGSSPYQGSPASALAGTWNVAVAGETGTGLTVVPSYTYFNVLPYTYLGDVTLTPQTAGTVPLLSGAGNYVIEGASFNRLAVRGVSLRLQDCLIRNLTVVDSSVSVSGGTLNSVSAVNSTVSLSSTTVQDARVGIRSVGSNVTVFSTIFRNVTYAFAPSRSSITYNSTAFVSVGSLSTVPAPSFSLASSPTATSQAYTFVATVNGTGLRVLSVLLDGSKVAAGVVGTPSHLTVSVPLDTSLEPDGPHTLTVIVSDGLPYTHVFTIYNYFHGSSAQATFLSLSAVAFAASVASLAALVYFSRRFSRRLRLAGA